MTIKALWESFHSIANRHLGLSAKRTGIGKENKGVCENVLGVCNKKESK